MVLFSKHFWCVDTLLNRDEFVRNWKSLRRFLQMYSGGSRVCTYLRNQYVHEVVHVPLSTSRVRLISLRVHGLREGSHVYMDIIFVRANRIFLFWIRGSCSVPICIHLNFFPHETTRVAPGGHWEHTHIYVYNITVYNIIIFSRRAREIKITII